MVMIIMVISLTFLRQCQRMDRLAAIEAPWNDWNGILSGCMRVYKFNTIDWVQMGSGINGEEGDWSGSLYPCPRMGTWLPLELLMPIPGAKPEREQ